MGNRTKRPPGRPKPESKRPSTFFIVALVIGVAILMWIFSQTATRPSPPPTATTPTSTRT